MNQDSQYIFTPSPSPDRCEWPGESIGVSNTITRTKGRTAIHNKTVDATPGLLERLSTSVSNHRKSAGCGEKVHSDDVIIHGIRVRAVSNSDHLHDFWIENWYSPEEWRQ